MEQEAACAAVADDEEQGVDCGAAAEEQEVEAKDVIQPSPWMERAIAMRHLSVALYEESAGPLSMD
jgi:hypothetical protein